MSDLRPLVEEGAPAYAVALLRSADADAPPVGADQTLLAALQAPPARPAAWPKLAVIAGLVVAAAVAWRALAPPSTPLRAQRTPVTHAPEIVAPVLEQPSVAVDQLPLEAPSAPARVARPNAAVAADDGFDLVDGARAALKTDPARTLSLVATYRRSHPANTFGDEMDALEVQALAALQSPRARTAATIFAQKHPGSAYAQRVRSAVERMP